MDTQKQYVKFSNDRWKNRRRMAWICLIFSVFVTVAFMFLVPTDRLAGVAPVLSWFYAFSASVVGTYIGFATVDDKNQLTLTEKNEDDKPI